MNRGGALAADEPMTDDGYPHRVGGFVRIMFGWPLRPRRLNTPPGAEGQ
jgi:hypothetical protein